MNNKILQEKVTEHAFSMSKISNEMSQERFTCIIAN